MEHPLAVSHNGSNMRAPHFWQEATLAALLKVTSPKANGYPLLKLSGITGGEKIEIEQSYLVEAIVAVNMKELSNTGNKSKMTKLSLTF